MHTQIMKLQEKIKQLEEQIVERSAKPPIAPSRPLSMN